MQDTSPLYIGTARSAALSRRPYHLQMVPTLNCHPGFQLSLLEAVLFHMACFAQLARETKGNRDSPVLKARQNSWNYLPKSGCMSQLFHHLHLSLGLSISIKGNPCSRSNRHGDTGLFKPYKAAQKLRA